MSKGTSAELPNAIEIPDPNNYEDGDDDTEVFEGSKELDSAADETPVIGADFDYIPGSHPVALGPYEHLFTGPGCAYETLNPSELMVEFQRLRSAGLTPATTEVPNVPACARSCTCRWVRPQFQPLSRP